MNDAAGQPTSWDGATGNFSYDLNGNLVSMTGNPSITDIAYDHRNLSIHTYLDGDVEQIANYNAEGQRILKEVQTPGGTTWDFYVRDGLSTLAVVSNGDLQFMNLHGNGTFGRVAANSGVISASGDKRYYIADLLGSVRAVVDESGDVKENRDYDPWGVPMDQRQYVSGDKALEQFSGQELDDQTGWYHFGQRDLMAIYGRWPSPDRFADKYPSHSPYSYALNDPVRFIDVNGDTVSIDPELLRPVVYEAGHERAGQKKGISDMTPREKGAYYFQQYLNNGGAEELAAFHIGGEFETTNIDISFGTQTPPQLALGFIPIIFTSTKVPHGLTTFGLRSEDVSLHDAGGKASMPRTSLDNIDFHIYLHPDRTLDRTPAHEMMHVRYITGQFLMGQEIKSGGYQHDYIFPRVPTVKQLIEMNKRIKGN